MSNLQSIYNSFQALGQVSLGLTQRIFTKRSVLSFHSYATGTSKLQKLTHMMELE